MNKFVFENSTKVYFGEGCVKEHLPRLLAEYRGDVMLAYGGGSIKRNGAYEDIMEVLKGAGRNVVEFTGIMANPTYAKVMEGAALARAERIGLILGAGGGSVMDCCKAISLAAVYDGDVWSEFWAKPGVIDFELLPLGVVVTVAGTGSEMNGGAVITNEGLKVKTILRATQNLPSSTPLTLTASRQSRRPPAGSTSCLTLWRPTSASPTRITCRTTSRRR